MIRGNAHTTLGTPSYVETQRRQNQQCMRGVSPGLSVFVPTLWSNSTLWAEQAMCDLERSCTLQFDVNADHVAEH